MMLISVWQSRQTVSVNRWTQSSLTLSSVHSSNTKFQRMSARIIFVWSFIQVCCRVYKKLMTFIFYHSRYPWRSWPPCYWLGNFEQRKNLGWYTFASMKLNHIYAKIKESKFTTMLCNTETVLLGDWGTWCRGYLGFR